MSKDTFDFPAPVPWDELPEEEPEIICPLIWDEEDL